MMNLLKKKTKTQTLATTNSTLLKETRRLLLFELLLYHCVMWNQLLFHCTVRTCPVKTIDELTKLQCNLEYIFLEINYAIRSHCVQVMGDILLNFRFAVAHETRKSYYSQSGFTPYLNAIIFISGKY